jgi:hypothetical protein
MIATCYWQWFSCESKKRKKKADFSRPSFGLAVIKKSAAGREIVSKAQNAEARPPLRNPETKSMMKQER